MENPTSDEKVLAALAHVSVLFAFFGPVVPTMVWVFQRDKSKYVRFHALQAMGYQAFAFWGWMVGIFFAVFGSILLSIGIGALMNIDMDSDTSAFPFLVQAIMIFSIFSLWGIFFLGGILGAVFCMINRDFRYPIIGSWLGKKLFDEQITDAGFEKWEDDWVSGVCHSTAFLQIWGVITPLIVWFSQKGRSAKLRFQALQAFIYQFIAAITNILVSVFGGLLYFIFIFGILVFGGASKGSGNTEHIPPVLGILFFIFLGGLMLFWLVSMVAVPLYYLLAVVASVRTIRGHDFKYPILGKIIAHRIDIANQKVIPAL